MINDKKYMKYMCFLKKLKKENLKSAIKETFSLIVSFVEFKSKIYCNNKKIRSRFNI